MVILEQQLEEFETGRTKWLTINLIGFFIWDALRITNSYLLDGSSNAILMSAMLLGCIIWLASLIQLIRLGLKVSKSKKALQIFNDELISINRQKTWGVALFAVCMVQVAIMLITTFGTEISGIMAAELSIFVGIISIIGGFLYYNRDSNE